MTTILTGVFLGYTRGSDAQIVLFRDRDVLIGSLNYAKALAAQKFNANPRACAFCMNLTRAAIGYATVIRVFQDVRPVSAPLCKDSVTGAYHNDFQFISTDDAVVSTYTIDSRVAVMVAGAQTFNQNFLFIPPELIATTSVSGGFPVTLEMSASSFVTRVSMHEGGQITTQ